MRHSSFSMKVVAGLSVLWSLASILYIGAISFITIPADNIRFVDTILGFILGTIIATILNFWLGSSLGSKVKAPENRHEEFTN